MYRFPVLSYRGAEPPQGGPGPPVGPVPGPGRNIFFLCGYVRKTHFEK